MLFSDIRTRRGFQIERDEDELEYSSESTICPECNGTGKVEVSLEEEYSRRGSTIEEDCRCCFGSGII